MTSPRKSSCRPAAGLMIVRLPEMKILFLKRSEEVSLPGHWTVPGGSVEEDEPEIEGAIREGEEEVGGLPDDLEIDETPWVWRSPYVCFSTFLGITRNQRWEPELNWENDEWRWADVRKLPRPLMPGTREAINNLLR